MIILLGPMSPSASSDATRRLGRDYPQRLPISSCFGWGLPCDRRYRQPGELLPHPFTLTQRHGKDHATRRSPFCGTFLPVARTGRYPAPCPMELGLSSPPAAEKRQARGSDHLTYSILTAPSDMSLYLPPAGRDLWPHSPTDQPADSVHGLHDK